MEDFLEMLVSITLIVLLGLAMIIYLAVMLVAYVLIAITSPIWIIPYLIYQWHVKRELKKMGDCQKLIKYARNNKKN